MQIRYVVSLLAVGFVLAGCQGAAFQGSGSLPTATQNIAPAVAPDAAAPAEAADSLKPDGHTLIQSSCGTHVKIVLAGFGTCQFSEAPYPRARFFIDDQTNGLVSVNPKTGTRSTKFVITGLVLGHGDLYITDRSQHHLRVYVNVVPHL